MMATGKAETALGGCVMLSVCVPVNDLAALDEKGCPVRINGSPTVLRRGGGYLRYTDDSGKEHRCKILESHEVLDGCGVRCVCFSAASHGAENQRHAFVCQDGTVLVEGDQITLVRD
jgi:hypothetical protein